MDNYNLNYSSNLLLKKDLNNSGNFYNFLINYFISRFNILLNLKKNKKIYAYTFFFKQKTLNKDLLNFSSKVLEKQVFKLILKNNFFYYLKNNFFKCIFLVFFLNKKLFKNITRFNTFTLYLKLYIKLLKFNKIFLYYFFKDIGFNFFNSFLYKNSSKISVIRSPFINKTSQEQFLRINCINKKVYNFFIKDFQKISLLLFILKIFNNFYNLQKTNVLVFFFIKKKVYIF